MFHPHIHTCAYRTMPFSMLSTIYVFPSSHLSHKTPSLDTLARLRCFYALGWQICCKRTYKPSRVLLVSEWERVYINMAKLNTKGGGVALVTGGKNPCESLQGVFLCDDITFVKNENSVEHDIIFASLFSLFFPFIAF